MCGYHSYAAACKDLFHCLKRSINSQVVDNVEYYISSWWLDQQPNLNVNIFLMNKYMISSPAINTIKYLMRIAQGCGD